MASLLGPEDHWWIWSALLGSAWFGLWAERQRWGAKLSGAVIAIASTFMLSNAGVIPVASPSYDFVWSWFVPLAIPLLLVHADLRRIVREAGATLIAFAIGAVGTVLGTFLAFRLIPLGEEGYRLAGIFCATYVGGSMNYVAAAEALELRSADLLTAGIAADNLMMTLYFLVIFALPSWGWLRRRYPRRVHDFSSEVASERQVIAFRPTHLMAALFASATVCAVGFTLAGAVGQQSLGILFVTAISVALATAFPRQAARLEGAAPMGMFLMMIFFAAIGAAANILVVVRQGILLFALAAIILTVHLFFLLIVGRIFRLDLAELLIASNANMGGPTTAAAMASARRWEGLVTPAILCGTLGYAVGTFVGVAVGNLLR